jgi:salicylate hydroxylase
MGPKMHVVAYPVRAGTLYNLVVIVQDDNGSLEHGWDLRPLVQGLPLPEVVHNRDLASLLEAVDQWRYWVLCDRAPLSNAKAMVPHPRVALLGDAAHPMLPFLAQGAAMAIEDAHVLAHLVGLAGKDHGPAGVEKFGEARWRRNSQVQAGARRNAHIFHLKGPVAWARDAALKLAAPRLLDMPWLYGRSPAAQI